MDTPRYFRIVDQGEFPGRWHLGAPSAMTGEPLDARVFTSATQFTGQAPVVVGVRSSGARLEFTLADFDMPVVSSSVAAQLQALASDELQLVPATIAGIDGDYFVLNVLGVAPCLDEEASRVSRWQASDQRLDKLGQYRSVAEVRVDATRAGNHKLFRIQGWKIALIASREVRHELLGAEVTGVRFEPV